MTVTNIKCPYFNYTKSFTVADNHIILYSGTRVVILNKRFELLGEIKGLKFVYDGRVSPDGKNLLLLSQGSFFYVVSLDDFSVIKITLKRKYKGDIMGVGCWSFDSRYIFIQSTDDYCFSHILKYDTQNDYSFEEVPPVDVQVRHISYVNKKEKYLIVCMGIFDHYWRFVWTDFNTKTTFVLKDFDSVVFGIDINEDSQTITVTGVDRIWSYDFEGNKKSAIDVPLDTFNFSFSGVFDNTYVDKNDISRFCDLFGLENLKVSEGIDCASFSKDNSMIYVGTMHRLLILDAKDLTVLKQIKYEFGVRSTYELEDNILMVETFSGIKLLKLKR